jgi:hypothetical protein
VKAARDIAGTEGHLVGVSKSDALVKANGFYKSWKDIADAETRLELATKGASATPVETVSPTKVATAPPAPITSPTKIATPLRKAISVAPEDAEMADATETASVATDQGKGKGKERGKDKDKETFGYDEIPWPAVRASYSDCSRRR